jgi:hypothetical protein
MIYKVVAALSVVFATASAHAEVYCKTVGVPKGCVMRPVGGAGAPGVGVLPGAGAGAAGVGLAPGAGVGAPGPGVTPGVNRGGPVNRVGPR